MGTPMTKWLDVQEFATLVGCTPNRLRFLYRCGLLKQWGLYMSLDTAAMAGVSQLIVMQGEGVQVVRFHEGLLTDPRLYALCTNTVDPLKWGPGWSGARDSRFNIFLDTRRVKVLGPWKKITPMMKRISRIPTKARA